MFYKNWAVQEKSYKLEIGNWETKWIKIILKFDQVPSFCRVYG